MKPIQTPPPREGDPTPPSTTLPRLWPHLEPERQRQIAQCIAQLILRLRPVPQPPVAKENADASP
jgi:hypothetical protein